MNHTNISSQKSINKEVAITAWYFRNRNGLISFPKRMEFDHQEYVFAEGLRLLIQKGKGLIQLFDMTDGHSNYRLRFDTAADIWTLVSINTVRA